MRLTPELVSTLPMTHRASVLPEYLDEMGHMNIQHYIGIFDRGGWGVFALVGIDIKTVEETHYGMFALKQYIQYFAEAREGDQLRLHGRFLGRSEQRAHFIQFMVNETRDNVAASFEVLGTFVDLRVRRPAPFPGEVGARLDAIIAEHNALDWQPPLAKPLSV